MLNCELAVVLKAVRQVETSGKGAFGFWYARHSFRGAYLWNQLKKKYLNLVDYVKDNEAS